MRESNWCFWAPWSQKSTKRRKVFKRENETSGTDISSSANQIDPKIVSKFIFCQRLPFETFPDPIHAAVVVGITWFSMAFCAVLVPTSCDPDICKCGRKNLSFILLIILPHRGEEIIQKNWITWLYWKAKQQLRKIAMYNWETVRSQWDIFK